jgi:tetratricopeptide (TPR) repeat protein
MQGEKKTLPWLVAVELCLEQERWSEAEAMLRKHTAACKKNHTAAHLFAISLLKQEKYSEALPWGEDAVAAAPQNGAYCQTLGLIYFGQKNYHQSISVWHTSLYVCPLQPDVLCLLASAYRLIGDSYAAIDYYQQALEVHPSHGTLHYHLAQCFNEAGLLEDAARHYAKAYAYLPYHAPLLRDYAENSLVMAQYHHCASILEHAGRLYPQRTDLQHLRGLLFFRTDQFDEALETYERALGICPNDREMLLDYAVCLRTIGDDHSAEKVLQRVQALS